MCIMAVPVLNTRQVLLDHLLAKVTPLCSSKLLAKEVLLEIANNLQNKDILDLLQNDKSLFQVVNKSNACYAFRYKNEKQELGDELFFKVSDIESDLCAKLTGMLLELDTNTIKQMLNDEELLSKAIIKAKKEYVEYTNLAKKREDLGEKLYDLVCEKYRPEIASRLTGMLLELEPEIIEKLLKNPKDLEDKLNLAYNAVSTNIKIRRYASNMANQQELSDFIKKVHIDLRLSSRQVGAKTAWEEHCKRKDILEKYAETMRDLATIYWDRNSDNDQLVNRINWVVKECARFFSNEGQKEMFMTEQRLAHRYFDIIEKEYNDSFPDKKIIKLLDIGSCYNPFKNFDIFEVTAVDLAPASEDVLRCDFLSVNIGDGLDIQEGILISFPRQYFDVVVLSLVLEYLPHPLFRHNCCAKAYELLRPGGALLIITPDSKHASANSQIIKNWRLALADIGFLKVTYEKTEHLHCMSYIKCYEPRIAKHWFTLNRKHLTDVDAKYLMIIPQDNVQYKTESESDGILERCESDNKSIAENFSELAGESLF